MFGRRFHLCTLAVSLLGVALSFARTSQANEPQPIVRFDPEARPPASVQTSLLVAGTAVTAIFYGGAVGASYAWQDDPGSQDLRLPIVGPWLKVSQTKWCQQGEENCNNPLQVAGAVLAVLSGLGQAGGIGLLLEGIFFSGSPAGAAHATPPGSSSFSLQTQKSRAPWMVETGGVTWTPVPYQAGSDLGFGFIGTF